MIQQVNLYQSRFHLERISVRSGALVSTLALTLVAGAGLHVFASSQVSGLKARVETLAAQRAGAATRLAMADAVVPIDTVDPVMESRIADRTARLRARQALRRAIAEQGADGARRVSDLMTGLARRHVDELTVSRFEIGDSGRRIELEGRASSPDRVPALIRALGDEPALSGYRFRSLSMQRVSASGPGVEFALTAAPRAR